MASIRKSLLQLIFSGSFMKRWNDKLRPMELLEVDKQAHKMIVAWMLFELNSRDMAPDQRLVLGRRIVEGGIFEYLYRLVITDIKPPVFYQIKANPAHYRQLTDWVLEQLKPRVDCLGASFWERFRLWLDHPEEGDLARRILDAAHSYASRWEFHLITNIGNYDDELEEIEESFRGQLETHKDLLGMPELLQGTGSHLGRLAHLSGQLRFQKRWSQTPRVPETSVLGHMFVVACFGYFFSMAVGACSARSQNNFFAGLVHDLPELLTRDIISPVKRSVARIGDLIREYEMKELEKRVFAPLEQGGYTHLAERLSYFLGLNVGSEFVSTIILEGLIREVTWEQLQESYNQDRFDPKDGNLLKVCDNLAAFMEAYTSLRNGISSDQLQQALWRIRTEYQQVSLGDGMHIGALLADFD
ncbi:putative hydrolases of HD superfamily [Desulfonatronum thiosulfatophilum]|uniref:Putative hydrolases of HD superfamily n=1 Tax=Desulfonatronum thiosulfatophilum TaxID=617002 RepID=A0A1G6ANL7_9BACT|nr:HD domain-containing protein [Desulfonatronum thiosulfatophilum]SDB09998.1 putative hydrolases of HD superfamily [Desulfonatronum thiosulfatophilum]